MKQSRFGLIPRTILVGLFVLSCLASASAKQGANIQLSVDRSSVASGASVNLTATLSSPAGSVGLNVPIYSSNTSLIPNQSCFIRAGQTTGRVTFSPNYAVTVKTPVSLSTGAVTSAGSVALIVVPPSLASVRTTSTAMRWGTTFGLITFLDGYAVPGGMTITLTSSNPNVVQVPPTAFVPGGSVYCLYYRVASPVTQPTVVTFTASWNGIVKQCSITVYP